jgi:hypothetical protein
MLERILIVSAVLLGAFVFYKVSMFLKEEYLQKIGIMSSAFILAFMSLGSVVNWVIDGNVNWVWSNIPYLMVPAISIFALQFGQMFFKICHIFLDRDYQIKNI